MKTIRKVIDKPTVLYLINKTSRIVANSGKNANAFYCLKNECISVMLYTNYFADTFAFSREIQSYSLCKPRRNQLIRVCKY